MHKLTFFEDIYVASPSFFEEIMRAGENYSKKHKVAIYKYWSRACTRSTPFGLFACCSSGKIGDKTKIILNDKSGIIRKTRLDMNYICSIVQYIERQGKIRDSLLFFPNDSIYSVGEKLRYIEYFYSGTKRKHVIQEIDKSTHLLTALNESKKGKTLLELSHLIQGNNISFEDAYEFINELADEQILKSEIEPYLTGDDILTNIITILENKGVGGDIIVHLKAILELLEVIDSRITHSNSLYLQLKKELDYFPIKYEEKYLLQTDTLRVPSEASLSYDVIESIRDSVDFLQRVQYVNNIESDLTRFKAAFISRYENETIPLLEALDDDIGLGYPVGVKRDKHDFIKNILVGNVSNKFHEFSLSTIEVIIARKYIEFSHKSNIDEIELSDDDAIYKKGENDIERSITISVMCEIANGGESIYIKSLGGSTAASLLGRFCYLETGIDKLVKDICNFEKEYMGKDVVVAEIVHLPESRIGNISSRTIIRNREIHYLAKPGIDRKKSIAASELKLRIINNKLELIDNNGSTVIPYLSNAHNYTLNTTPVYRFLCDYQFNLYQPIYPLNLNNLLQLFEYVPRIRYKNTILALRQWKLDKFKFKVSGNKVKFDKDVDEKILEWKSNNSVPNKILIKESDNELFLELDKEFCRELLYDYLQKRSVLIIEEFFLDGKDSVVSNGKKQYCSEFIIPFHK